MLDLTTTRLLAGAASRRAALGLDMPTIEHARQLATDVKDFAWWTKLIAADVKTGLTIARPQLERIEVDGIEYFMHPQTPALLDSSEAV